MKLTYFQGNPTNFGDEINAFMWNHLVPEDFFDENTNDLFLGIGSIIWDNFPKNAVKHVIGSGYGGYTALPDIRDADWNICWVRGPLTAQALGIDPRLAIADSAILLRAIPLPDPADDIDVAFMPHFESIERGNWAEVCRLAGVTFLDPRDDPLSLIAKIRGARIVLTEAMHGAIVADALRTPFIPFMPIHSAHRMKWDDWAASLGLKLEKYQMPASTAIDFYVQKTGNDGKGRASMRLRHHQYMRPIHRFFTEAAAYRINEIIRDAEPTNSSDSAISRATEMCLDHLQQFIAIHSSRS